MTITLLIFIFYRFLNIFLFPFIFTINFLKKEYYRHFSLNTLKKKILDKKETEQKIQKDTYSEKKIDSKKEEREKRKINKLFLEVQIAKER